MTHYLVQLAVSVPGFLLVAGCFYSWGRAHERAKGARRLLDARADYSSNIVKIYEASIEGPDSLKRLRLYPSANDPAVAEMVDDPQAYFKKVREGKR